MLLSYFIILIIQGVAIVKVLTVVCPKSDLVYGVYANMKLNTICRMSLQSFDIWGIFSKIPHFPDIKVISRPIILVSPAKEYSQP